jgi:hypothetical protein
MNNLFEFKIKHEILNVKTHDFVSRTKTYIVNATNQEEAENRI